MSEPEPDPTGVPGEQDPLQAAADALARARRSARERGLRPGRPASGGGPRAGDLTRRRSGVRHPTARDPQLLDTEVGRLLDSRGWGGQVQVGAVVGRWSTIVGEAVASHVTPVAFTGTTLTVQSDSSAWATQMRLLASSVLARIEAEVGPGVVTEIQVHGPAGPSWRKGPLLAPGPGPRDTYG